MVRICQHLISKETAELIPYDPPLSEVVDQGSTSFISRMRPVVVLKFPVLSYWNFDTQEAMMHHPAEILRRVSIAEEQIMRILSAHFRIVP